jgi:hypothetical protein
MISLTTREIFALTFGLGVWDRRHSQSITAVHLGYAACHHAFDEDAHFNMGKLPRERLRLNGLERPKAYTGRLKQPASRRQKPVRPGDA